MSRLIDADALWKDITTRIEEYCDIADLIDIIERQPTIEPEQRWIPVTERLPDMRQIVLITNGKGNVRCGQYRGIDFVINGRQRWQWKGNTSEQVVAWQPLPEPYKEGEEDGN